MSKAYRDNYKLIKWAKPKAAEPKLSEERGKAAYYMPDIKEFRSPMSGRLLSSRKQVAHEERGFGVKQCGELKKVEDFDNRKTGASRTNDRQFDEAFRKGLQQYEQRNPHVRFND